MLPRQHNNAKYMHEEQWNYERSGANRVNVGRSMATEDKAVQVVQSSFTTQDWALFRVLRGQWSDGKGEGRAWLYSQRRAWVNLHHVWHFTKCIFMCTRHGHFMSAVPVRPGTGVTLAERRSGQCRRHAESSQWSPVCYGACMGAKVARALRLPELPPRPQDIPGTNSGDWITSTQIGCLSLCLKHVPPYLHPPYRFPLGICESRTPKNHARREPACIDHIGRLWAPDEFWKEKVADPNSVLAQEPSPMSVLCSFQSTNRHPCPLNVHFSPQTVP
jgi:hypothetical protein